MKIPEAWRSILEAETEQPYFADLIAYLDEERSAHSIFPPSDEVFSALEMTSYEDANVLLLGQDPYHDEGQAHGLCFSVKPGVKIPPSLRNIFKELAEDIGCAIPSDGELSSWARQGVLMLNTVLTVRAHEANSHRKKGWESFTDAIIRLLNEKTTPVIFVLWGKPAQRKLKLIDDDRHVVIQSPHPSPLSARRGFFGSQPFSQVNAALREIGHDEIDWSIV